MRHDGFVTGTPTVSALHYVEKGASLTQLQDAIVNAPR
jgi:hypothetical protein